MSPLTLRWTHVSTNIPNVAAETNELEAGDHRKAVRRCDKGEQCEADRIADSARKQTLTAQAQAEAAN